MIELPSPQAPRLPRLTSQSRRPRWLALALGCVLVSGVGVASPAFAEPAKQPQVSAREVINAAIAKALGILRDKKLQGDSKARMAKLRAAVDGVFDWDTMARSSIGPQWRSLDATQRAEFVGVFKELLAKQYMDDIDRFQGSEQLRVVGDQAQGERRLVKTVLITVSREEVPIDYTLHNAGGSWLVEDVAIEGVSMVNHYRKTFSRFLVNNDFATLMKKLKHKLGRR